MIICNIFIYYKYHFIILKLQAICNRIHICQYKQSVTEFIYVNITLSNCQFENVYKKKKNVKENYTKYSQNFDYSMFTKFYRHIMSQTYYQLVSDTSPSTFLNKQFTPPSFYFITQHKHDC